MIPGSKNNKVPLTPKVREAIALALDYKGIIDVTVGGAGRFQPSTLPIGFPGSENLPMPEQDLAKAKKLLSEAGLAKGFEIEARQCSPKPVAQRNSAAAAARRRALEA